MPDSFSLIQISQRQVETNRLLVAMLDVMEVMKDNQTIMAERLVNLDAWLKEPPKSDLPDLIRQLVAAMEGVQKQISELVARVHAL